MTKLENLHIQLKTHYHIEEEALEQLKSHRLNDNEIRDMLFESCSEDFEHSLKSELESLKQDCTITKVHIDIDYPITDVYLDADIDCDKDTFIESAIKALTQHEHSSYARFSELEDSVSGYVVFEELDAEQ